MVNEENQPPQKSSVLAYERTEDSIKLDCLVEWQQPYNMPPTYVIKQWNDEAYAGTRYRRRIIWKGHYFIDVVTVQHPEVRCTDWIVHVDGEPNLQQAGKPIKNWSNKKPLCYLKEVLQLQEKSIHTQEWKTVHGYLRLFSFGTGIQCFTGVGPNNPPTRKLYYTVQRQRAKKCLFVNLFETYQRESVIQNVQIRKTESGVCILVNHEEVVLCDL